jgi:hypothetical protein
MPDGTTIGGGPKESITLSGFSVLDGIRLQ